MEPVQGWEVESLVLRVTARSRAVHAVTAEGLFFGKTFLGNSKEYYPVDACLAVLFIT